MTTSWIGMLSSIEPAKPIKLQEVLSTSPSKIIFVEEIFQDINKHHKLTISQNFNKIHVKIVKNMFV
jgi:hypothetical protein